MAIDVTATRERQRRIRLIRLSAFFLIPVAGWLWYRVLTSNPISPGLPDLPPEAWIWMPGIAIVLLLGVVLVAPMIANSRSPHSIFLPEQLEVGFSDVKGLGPVVAEVRHTLDVFLNHKRFKSEMGGSPRRGVLFEGPPGTGKTHVAKAMAKEAGVPFLFVSATSFQSMWYGMTARKIRTFFRDLRKVARAEGGAIGFIEEFDAIGIRRGGMSPSVAHAQGPEISAAVSEGVGGVVNELLVQMQSFDQAPRGVRFGNWMRRLVNRYLPQHLHLATKPAPFANILLIGATNRADSLDPALLRPGRFDRILHFDVPGKGARRELIDYFLSKKAHEPGLEDDAVRDDLAAVTMGYTPASMERLFDEALLVALREQRSALSALDVRRARMEVEIGLPQPVEYAMAERESIAVHEAGHAVMAYLVGKGRKLEVLSIIKRRQALGLLAHSEEEERFTKRRSEMKALIQIAMGGMVAEEVFFGESGTGPAGDLASATSVAVEMVGSLGMGGSLVSYRSIESGLVGGNLAAKVLSDDVGRNRVERILEEGKEEARRVIGQHRHLVEALRDALLEREELVDDEIIEVLRDAELEAMTRTDTVVDLRPFGSPIELLEP
jgi:ATP-dependent Zn protease